MEPGQFIRQIELLTGSDIKSRDQVDDRALTEILKQDSTPLDCSRFNELLLLVHKDRLEEPFFKFFFGRECTISHVPECVAKFQKVALLLYGNFVFAYRRLSRMKDSAEFQHEVASVSKDPQSELAHFRSRPEKLLDVERIGRELTPYVGYLSMQDVSADRRSCEFLIAATQETSAKDNWDALEKLIGEMAQPDSVGPLLTTVRNYRETAPEANVGQFGAFLDSSLAILEQKIEEVKHVRDRAARNQDVYLTWDYMDVYFATSMRKAWEYMDLYDFIQDLMSSGEFADLGIRYFDPTQAYTEDRINKGLVESLMLKRARCTVYSVQDTDTLGKDSELASTLAQGKPVIAFVPEIPVHERAAELGKEAPKTILERLRFILYADERLAQFLKEGEYALLDRIQDELAAHCSKRIWPSIVDADAEAQFRDFHRDDLLRLCDIIARSEKRVYDRRANALKEVHPLALQVNLNTGVANGVLVVRTIQECAELLRRILVSNVDYRLQEQRGMWLLRERISNSIYRVATGDRKLNNCFWNFYLR